MQRNHISHAPEFKASFNENAWQSAADPLAAWAAFMVVLWVAHGRYRPIHKRGDRRPAYTLRRKATEEDLRRHFLGKQIIGLHAISPKNRSRWIAVDIDDHSLTGEKSAANRDAAVAWYGDLRLRGFEPLLTESSAGSFHLLVRFDDELPSELAHRFGNWIVRNWRDKGLGARPEVFPKQSRLNPPRVKFGNWLRLPGRHHTHDWTSRAFDGSTWLDSAATVQHILSIAGDSIDLIPQAARDYRPDKPTKRRRSTNTVIESLPAEFNDIVVADVLSDFDEEVQHHVTVVASRMRHGTRNKLTFELYRRILSTRLGKLPLSDHLPMFVGFFELSRDRQRTQGFRECRSDYCRSADSCRSPWGPSVGGPIERAIEAANSIPSDQLPKLHRCRESTRRLAAVCQLLANFSPAREIGLPQYTLAKLMGVSQPAVSKSVSSLIRLGFLVRTRQPEWNQGNGVYAGYRLRTPAQQ